MRTICVIERVENSYNGHADTTVLKGNLLNINMLQFWSFNCIILNNVPIFTL